jgi:hypothetical protein
MPFQIRMGVPEMDQLWLDLSTRSLQGGLDKEEQKFFKKTRKNAGALGFGSAA